MRGVGKQIAKHLERLDIFSNHDLLFHLPYRYQDRTQIQSINEIVPGNEVVIEGIITNVTSLQKGKTKLLCELRDGTGKVYLRFFHVLSFQASILKTGTKLRCYSEVRLGPKGLEMVHPEIKVIHEGQSIPPEQHLTPIYPATEGLSQYTLRKLTSNVLDWLHQENAYIDLLPAYLVSHTSISFKEALNFLHRPPRETPISDLIEGKTQAQRRLVFEELLTHRVSLLTLKQDFQSQKSIALMPNHELINKFVNHLPFSLTNAQQRVISEIQQDLTRSYPMLRLVQGDVGSGKTVVAACAMLQAIHHKHQALMMAPTELLAEQHYRVFQKWFEPLGINVVYLSGNVKGKARTKVLEDIENGEAQIILGTHALFQQEVNFHQLTLIIVDEQHRFGVQQRALLRKKGSKDFYPHQLIMTATPIPRTLAMSFYADLDSSIIDKLPPGRTPIKTSVISASKRMEVIERVREACQQGRQVYWVCPLIEESEVLSCQAATQVYEQLLKGLPELKVGLIHGKMRAQDKEATMALFKQGEIHLLVATTVIEVGVDVPNASVMVIENAERLGLSQLHQLRGRVGRGSIASHCILLYQYPVSDIAKERLAVMRETTDGFKIAQRDLELRGPGEVLGTRQTGELTFRIADLLRDSNMLNEVQKAADILIRDHSDIIKPLMQRWLKADAEYGKV